MGPLMDNGANGSMAGDDVLITAYHNHDHAQVTGIAGNSLDDLRIVTASGLIESTDGPPIGIFRQYTHPLCSIDAGHRCSHRLHKYEEERHAMSGYSHWMD